MKIVFISFLLIFSIDVNAQVPVVVNRSTINARGYISLPAYSGSASYSSSDNFFSTPVGFSNSGAFVDSMGGSGSGNPSSGSPGSYNIVLLCYPQVLISTNAPSAFTNTVSAYANYYRVGVSAPITLGPISQSYAYSVIEDGGGGGTSVSTSPMMTLFGQGDTLEAISRNSTDNAPRKLLGFSLVANTNSTVTSLAFILSNTTTNSPANQNLSSITLYQDTDGGGTFESSDTPVATTTNSSGIAVFSGLTEPITSSQKNYFLTASFMPTNQSKNSFIAASLSTQNIAVRLASTNVNYLTTGGSILGKQYGFLDSTFAEEAAYAASLTNGLLNASQVNSLISSATNGLGSSSSTSTNNSSSFSDSILPAAAAGAAGVAAAFSSDSISKTPLSREFTQPK